MKKILKALLTIGVLALVIVSAYQFYINKDARNISEEAPEFTVEATALSGEFGADAEKATQKYLNKTIEVRGEVAEVNGQAVTLAPGVFCQCIQPATVQSKQMVTIKGRLIGFDELLSEIKIDECTVQP